MVKIALMQIHCFSANTFGASLSKFDIDVAVDFDDVDADVDIDDDIDDDLLFLALVHRLCSASLLHGGNLHLLLHKIL